MGESNVKFDKVMFIGFGGVRCVEFGGLEFGVGCVGCGVIMVINFLEEFGVFIDDFDFVFYDVLGDVVCGGFVMLIREGKVNEIYIVVFGEMMVFYVVNNICRGIFKFVEISGVRFGGIICNLCRVENEKEFLEVFCKCFGI